MGSLDNSEAFATSCGTSKWKLMKGDYNGEWSVQHWKSFKEWSLPPRSAMFFFLVDRQDMSSLHFDSVLRTFVAVNLFPKQYLHVFLIIIIIISFWQKNDHSIMTHNVTLSWAHCEEAFAQRVHRAAKVSTGTLQRRTWAHSYFCPTVIWMAS